METAGRLGVVEGEEAHVSVGELHPGKLGPSHEQRAGSKPDQADVAGHFRTCQSDLPIDVSAGEIECGELAIIQTRFASRSSPASLTVPATFESERSI